MSYPKAIAELRPVRGLVSDVPAHEVGPDFYTLMTNVITRGGFPQRLPGAKSVYETALASAAPAKILHGINAPFSGTNYWVLCDGTNVWAIEGTNATDIDATLFQAVAEPEAYSSALLNGVVVLSNGADEPVYWAGTGNMATLTDWTATETCEFIAAFQYHLFALNLSGPGGTFPSKLKWSAAAEPGTIPNSWTPGPSNEAGDVELSDSPGGLVCAYPMRDSLMIYKPSSTYQAKYVGGNNVFTFRKVAATSGALTRRSVCDINGRHLVVTDGDIVITDGTNRRSIGEARVKDWLFNQIDQVEFTQLFCSYNRAQGEVLIGFPSNGSSYCDTALVYNIELDSFGTRALDEVTHAPVGIVNDTTESNTWADRTEAWSAAVGEWSASTISAARESLVLFRNGDEMHQQDTDELESLNAYLGKYSMDLGDSSRLKFVRRVHVKAAADYGTLMVRVGSQMEPNDTITWSPEVTITDPEQIVNTFAQGRYISVELRSTGNEVWKLTGLDLEVELRGYF